MSFTLKGTLVPSCACTTHIVMGHSGFPWIRAQIIARLMRHCKCEMLRLGLDVGLDFLLMLSSTLCLCLLLPVLCLIAPL